MIYRVLVDGMDVYEEAENVAIISPVLTNEMNAAGSFEFSMYPEHLYYNIPSLLHSNVEVYEDNDLIWFGRPSEITIGFNKLKKIYCEGALAYFNDTVQPIRTFEGDMLDFFRSVITHHNNFELSPQRRFTIGRTSIVYPSKTFIKELKYERTWDVLKELLDEFHGYFFVRREEGVNYIDWLNELPYVGDETQPIQFGLNIIDLVQKTSTSDIKTSVVPLGTIDGETVTISDVNEGDDFLDSEAVSEFGRIMETVDFGDVDSTVELKALGRDWLTDHQFDPLSIEVNAAELHYIINSEFEPATEIVTEVVDTGQVVQVITINDENDPVDYGSLIPAFKVGQIVHCVSKPHLIDRDFPLTKITMNLDTGVKKITIGVDKEPYISNK